MTSALDGLRGRLRERTAVVGVIGLGYVGLPQALFAEAGYRVLGFDIDPAKPQALGAGHSYLLDIPSARVAALVSTGRFAATADFDRLGECDALIVCVPTPLSEHGEPDLSFVSGTASTIAPRLRPGQLVVLVSTTYPGWFARSWRRAASWSAGTSRSATPPSARIPGTRAMSSGHPQAGFGLHGSLPRPHGSCLRARRGQGGAGVQHARR